MLKNAGSLTPAGMPEAGYLPIPQKLARAGVKDMVRMSDCRMSGTAFGTIVLHITPEAAAGGPLGLVETGDRVRLSVRERRLDLLVAADVLARRRAAWRPPAKPKRGWDRWSPSRCCRRTRGAIWRCSGRVGKRSEAQVLRFHSGSRCGLASHAIKPDCWSGSAIQRFVQVTVGLHPGNISAAVLHSPIIRRSFA